MDSHADTCVAGSNCVVLEYTGRSAEVEAYSPDYPSKQIPIATVATAYDCPTSGATYVIIINEALYFGDSLPFSLLSPNQLRDNDVHVDERHRQHAPDSIFGILVPSEPLRIPFTLEGVVAGFDSRPQPKTSLIILPCMSNSPPTLSGFPHLRALARGGGCVGLRRRRGDYELASKALEGPTLQGNETEDQELHAGSCSEPVPFEMQIANEVNLLNQTDPILRRVAALTTTADASSEEIGIAAIRTGDVTSDVTPENVARRWMVGLETAKNSLKVTTQQGIRSIPNPATRRFKTQMAHLRYPRLRGMFYADIMEPKIKSIDSQRYAHIIGNGRGYTKAYPMERKNESIYALDDFVKKVGIPEVLLCDNDATMEGWGEWKKRIGSIQLIRSTRNPIHRFRTRLNWTSES
ncbi:Reverse transcriptase (RNA-dependent DNA polymerase) [Fragilaria crotonensis]|nr:Reverse transcriptase (RNA-dependent DNA polymerase) [Fragilaria crotonensis]